MTVQCPCEKLDAYALTFSEFEHISSFHFSPFDVVEHRHEDDPITELFRFDVSFLQIPLDFLKNPQ